MTARRPLRTARAVVMRLARANVVWMFVWYISHRYMGTGLSWEWAISCASLSTSVDVAWAYHQAAPSDRLDPVSATGVAVLFLVLLFGPLTSDPLRNLHWSLGGAFMVAALVGAMTPAVYLLAMGIRALTKSAGGEPPRND
jgi:hypothetical protein